MNFLYEYPDLPNNYDVANFAKGKYVKLENVSDPTFASGTMGKGFAINPEKGIIKSPVDGEVTMIFDTKHAIAIKSHDGIEVLIHIGFDTVQLKGKYFTTLVEVGDKVKKGQRLVKFNKKKINKKGFNTLTPLVVTNWSEFGVPEFENVTEFDDFKIPVMHFVKKHEPMAKGDK